MISRADDARVAENLKIQLKYYRERAQEYDEWWLRKGHYDRGPEGNKDWFTEIREIADALARARPHGQILELAPGTGNWSSQLLKYATKLTLVDGAPEMLEIAAKRLDSRQVKYEVADIFSWKPAEKFDFVFFSFWLSHVPSIYFGKFWNFIRECLNDDGRVFFIDSGPISKNDAPSSVPRAVNEEMTRRRLNDGRQFEIYKVFYEASELESRLKALGWDVKVRQTSKFFLFGEGRWGSSVGK